MSDDSLLKKGLGGIGDLGKQLGKGVVAEAKKTAKATVAQVGLENLADKEQNANPEMLKHPKGASYCIAAQVQYDSSDNNARRAKDNEDLIKAMYGKTEESQNSKLKSQNLENGEQNQGQRIAQSIAEKHPEMTPEEVQKTAQLRRQLHSEYYQQLTNPPKQQEERPAEKVEREKQEELMELQEKEEKKPKRIESLEKEKTKTERRPGAG